MSSPDTTVAFLSLHEGPDGVCLCVDTEKLSDDRSANVEDDLLARGGRPGVVLPEWSEQSVSTVADDLFLLPAEGRWKDVL